MPLGGTLWRVDELSCITVVESRFTANLTNYANKKGFRDIECPIHDTALGPKRWIAKKQVR